MKADELLAQYDAGRRDFTAVELSEAPEGANLEWSISDRALLDELI